MIEDCFKELEDMIPDILQGPIQMRVRALLFSHRSLSKSLDESNKSLERLVNKKISPPLPLTGPIKADNYGAVGDDIPPNFVTLFLPTGNEPLIEWVLESGPRIKWYFESRKDSRMFYRALSLGESYNYQQFFKGNINS